MTDNLMTTEVSKRIDKSDPRVAQQVSAIASQCWRRFSQTRNEERNTAKSSEICEEARTTHKDAQVRGKTCKQHDTTDNMMTTEVSDIGSTSQIQGLCDKSAQSHHTAGEVSAIAGTKEETKFDSTMSR